MVLSEIRKLVHHITGDCGSEFNTNNKWEPEHSSMCDELCELVERAAREGLTES